MTCLFAYLGSTQVKAARKYDGDIYHCSSNAKPKWFKAMILFLQKKTARYWTSTTMTSSIGLVICSMWFSTFISINQSWNQIDHFMTKVQKVGSFYKYKALSLDVKWPSFCIVAKIWGLSKLYQDFLLSVHVTVKQIGDSFFEENQGWEILRKIEK